VTRHGGPSSIWFNDRVREAQEASRSGDHQAAIELLGDLAEQCRGAARGGLSEWHEMQALWLLGIELEARGEFSYAARAYSRIAKLRREAHAEAAQGLGPAVAAAALSEFRAGNPKAGVKLATEALRINASHPLERQQVAVLEGELAKGRTRLRRDKARRLKRAASNKQMQRTRRG
jgi:hypothetical protein